MASPFDMLLQGGDAPSGGGGSGMASGDMYSNLTNNPIFALGYGLLTSRQNPIGAAGEVLKQGYETKRQAKQDKINEFLTAAKMQSIMHPAAKLQFNPVTGDMYDMRTGSPFNADGAPPPAPTPNTNDTNGLPAPDETPNPKAIMQTDVKVNADLFKDMNKAQTLGRQRLQYIDQFESATKGVKTGYGSSLQADIAQIPVLGRLAGGKEYATHIQNAESATNPMATSFRAPGTGASTNADDSRLLATVPNVSNTPEANKILVAAHRRYAKRDIDYGQTTQSLVRKGYSLPQVQKLFDDYTNANPIFLSNASVDNGINPNQSNSFDEWIKAGKPDNRPKGYQRKQAAPTQQGNPTQSAPTQQGKASPAPWSPPEGWGAD